MKLVRAVANVAFALVLAGCGVPVAGSAPLPTSRSAAEEHRDTVGTAVCADLVSSYQAWVASTSPWDYEPAYVSQRREEGEAFLSEVTGLDELPMTELAGAIAMYLEEVELLLAEYETSGEGSTYAVELAVSVVIEEVRMLADAACT